VRLSVGDGDWLRVLLGDRLTVAVNVGCAVLLRHIVLEVPDVEKETEFVLLSDWTSETQFTSITLTA
jgi:hypothetical protein